MNSSNHVLALGVVLAATGVSSEAWADGSPSGYHPAKSEDGKKVSPGGQGLPGPGLFGPVRAGPMVGISAPDGLGVGTIARYKIFGVGLFASYLPQITLPGLNAQLARMSLAADLRVYPLGGAFFLGVGIGYSQMKGTAEKSVRAYRQEQTALGSVFASGGMVAPEIGFLWTIPLSSRPGAALLSLGTDIGVAIPFASSEPRFAVTNHELTTDVQGKGSLADAVRFIQTHPTPVLNLLRVGVLL